MHVGIAGAGAIAMGYTALLISRGHKASVWSPSGASTANLRGGQPLKVSGAIEGEFLPGVCQNAKELALADVIVLALPAYGQRFVIDALVLHLEARHTVIISGHLSFAALYLCKRLAERGLQIPIAAWSTTALTCKAQSHNEVRVGALRKNVKVAVVPVAMAQRGVDICVNLFGENFTLQDDILTITLSNLNPQSHLAIALCNLTRLERGEVWAQRENITPTVGRFIEALDLERLSLAAAFGKTVGTVLDHYRTSFGLTGQSVFEISAQQVRRGIDVAGPKTIDSRYVLEDVPFGLVPLLYLADNIGIDMPLHRGGVVILSSCYGRNFIAENDFLSEIDAADLIQKFPKIDYAIQG
ncbi:NAD/NADP octopine/nopaline dehydrogenase family protein [Agrobacterium rubi]|uniref:NAD/NADP octopine/nopaline dehydrogenase n=1 Tax=Agrobacterium rubi TaxID=28099 RepID=A0ABX2JAL8_9HYPH|nr:NAD/NADP octopine/nopaline dehydrogenase family protein [Agrobacterium rubi]NTE89362.1 NAD/NADP octopine/nopaline dehydrogenase [Agrobacterium rubi]NTF39498.1 NAD/NADP octopine/nopaline dehydrogenase [Agrobacterium rubi]